MRSGKQPCGKGLHTIDQGALDIDRPDDAVFGGAER